MKKLMIMATMMICAIVAAQAAMCNWQLTTNGDSLYTDKGALFSGTGYMLSGNVAYDFINAMAGGMSFDAAIAAQTTAGTVTFASGETSSEFSYGTEIYLYDFTFVAKMADKILVDVYIWKAGAPGETTVISACFGDTADAEWRANNTFKMKDGWSGSVSYYTPESVPEPTSGLLMLLGMAGLALKRKRA